MKTTLNMAAVAFVMVLSAAAFAEDADLAAQNGRDALIASQHTPREIVKAARYFALAAAAYESVGNIEQAVEMNSFLYWCKKKMTSADMDEFLSDKDAKLVSKKLTEVDSKPIVKDDAEKWFARAESYEKLNSGRPLLAAIRYFEVADRFKGSEVSLKAQDRSLSLMQKSIAPPPPAPSKIAVNPAPESRPSMPASPAAASLAATSVQRQAIPSANEQAEALKLIKEIFKDDFAKSAPEMKKALAQKLIAQVPESKDSAATQYALLSEARLLSIQTKDAALALAAINTMGRLFSIDQSNLALQTKTLDELARFPSPPEISLRLADEYTSIADQYATIDNIQDAIKASTSAEQEYRKAKNLPGVTKTQDSIKRLRTQQSEMLKLSAAIATLKTAPDDPKANEAVGMYTCLYKNDWETGLPMLAKSATPALKKLAEDELTKPTDPAAQMQLADGWWEYAQKSSSKVLLQERAVTWYQLCRYSVTGLLGAKIDARLVSIAKPDSAKAAKATRLGELIQANRNAKGIPANAITFGMPIGDGRGGANGFWVPCSAEWEITGTRWDVVHEHAPDSIGMQIVHPFKTGHVMITIGKAKIHVLTDGIWLNAGHYPPQSKQLETTPAFATTFPIPNNTPISISTFLSATGQLQITVDGKVVGTMTIKSAAPFTFSEGFVPKGAAPLPSSLPAATAAIMIGPSPRNDAPHTLRDPSFYPYSGR